MNGSCAFDHMSTCADNIDRLFHPIILKLLYYTSKKVIEYTNITYQNSNTQASKKTWRLDTLSNLLEVDKQIYIVHLNTSKCDIFVIFKHMNTQSIKI